MKTAFELLLSVWLGLVSLDAMALGEQQAGSGTELTIEKKVFCPSTPEFPRVLNSVEI
ncbi:hypothetical protein [Polaromonas sp. LjRoot131]|uniref:hypothetical protein n=1 Tax=Polaromonas sp. LjRoot131 TaxID=3342262 RepID=UPI003ECE1E98